MTTEELREILSNPKGKIFAFDLDKTLCVEGCWGEKEMLNATPVKGMFELIDWIACNGGVILIFTARPSRFYSVTFAWLYYNNIYFHGICMQYKPHAHIYVDDLAFNVNDISKSFFLKVKKERRKQ